MPVGRFNAATWIRYLFSWDMALYHLVLGSWCF